MSVNSRATAAADALGSTQAEGLQPSKETLLLVESWVRGEIDDAQLEQAEQEIVAAASAKPATASH